MIPIRSLRNLAIEFGVGLFLGLVTAAVILFVVGIFMTFLSLITVSA